MVDRSIIRDHVDLVSQRLAIVPENQHPVTLETGNLPNNQQYLSGQNQGTA